MAAQLRKRVLSIFFLSIWRPVGFARVEAISRPIQSKRRGGGIENRKDSFDRFQEVGGYPAPVAAFVEPLQEPSGYTVK